MNPLKLIKQGQQVTAAWLNALVERVNRIANLKVAAPLSMSDTAAGRVIRLNRGSLPRIVTGAATDFLGRGGTTEINMHDADGNLTGDTHGVFDRGVIPADGGILEGVMIYVYTGVTDSSGNWLYIASDCDQEDITE